MEPQTFYIQLDPGIDLVYINHLTPLQDLAEEITDYLKAVPMAEAIIFLSEDYPELDFQLDQTKAANNLCVSTKNLLHSVRYH